MIKQKIPTKKEAQAELARRNIADFAVAVNPALILTPFHCQYYRILERFARGDIRKLIITIPPQHGKSYGSSVLLPAYMLGVNPELRIAIASYNLNLASKFNRQIQRIMDSRSYRTIFPATRLKQSAGADKNYTRTAEEFDIVGYSGNVKAVGREGALTGNSVDIMIVDDLYKDALEANSPVVRDNAWEWYVSVVKTRLHNDSREIIVMTRWSEDDIVGRIGKHGTVAEITSAGAALFNDRNSWYRLNFEALKESGASEIDPRKPGEALWEERHSAELLKEKRALDPQMFEALYQGRPTTRDGLLYGAGFETYTTLPPDTVKKGNYTDTADTGSDYLCSVCYEVAKDGLIYITDLVYSQQGMEYTEEAVAAMLNRNATRIARIESNNGGRGFARSVRKMTPAARIEWFHQSGNKESRIVTNHNTVLKHIVMPADWPQRWSEFHRDVSGYRRNFRANRYHDAADVLTGIVEYEVFNCSDRGGTFFRFSV